MGRRFNNNHSSLFKTALQKCCLYHRSQLDNMRNAKNLISRDQSLGRRQFLGHTWWYDPENSSINHSWLANSFFGAPEPWQGIYTYVLLWICVSYMKVYSKTQMLDEYLNSSNQQEEGFVMSLYVHGFIWLVHQKQEKNNIFVVTTLTYLHQCEKIFTSSINCLLMVLWVNCDLPNHKFECPQQQQFDPVLNWHF